MSEFIDIQGILKLIPHRYPFVMIDRILELETGNRIRAVKNVTINEPFFQGHFPGTPIMPGVMIVEAMGQAGGVLVMKSLPPEDHGAVLMFMGLDKVKFRKPVVPGDQLVLEVSIIKQRAKAVRMAGEAYVENEKVAEGQFLATIGDKS